MPSAVRWNRIAGPKRHEHGRRIEKER